jgi:hypothetical protein
MVTENSVEFNTINDKELGFSEIGTTRVARLKENLIKLDNI